MFKFIALGAALTVSSVVAAEPMKFEWGGSNGRCGGCGPFIQATGSIVASTADDFEEFLRREKFAPKLVRLHSGGGNLVAGIRLGEIFRKRGIATEIGRDDPNVDWAKGAAIRMSERKPGVCASSCAYAFLGGVERVIEDGSRFGVHRFYRDKEARSPTLRQFSGEDLDSTQKVMAGLLLYMIEMGVDPRVLSLATEAGAGEMRWLTPTEIRDLKVSYSPGQWQPWKVETFRGGARAISATQDGSAQMMAVCSPKFGPRVVLTDRQEDGTWFAQLKGCSETGHHPVFGAQVPARNVETFKVGTTTGISFKLPKSTPPLSSASLFADGPYPMACLTSRYGGSTENFVPALRLVLRNCTRD